MDDRAAAIAKVRSFNRYYTRILGLLGRHILSTDFSLTEARVLLEISNEENGKAHEIGERLSVDPSYLSRILRRFETNRLITRTPSPLDNRLNLIRLTSKGQAALDELSNRSNTQVSRLLSGLSQQEVSEVLAAMALIRDQFNRTLYPAVIRDYREGDGDYIVRRHEALYRKEYGFSSAFVAFVDHTVRNMIDRFDPARECVLIPEVEGKPMGSVAIVHKDDQTAQLRYFLLEPEARGFGLGLRLVETALAFCRRVGYKRVILTTISELTAARAIYSRMGFRIVQSRPQAEWGREVVEERWALEL